MREHKQDRAANRTADHTLETIGFTAGEIWHALNSKGEMPLTRLKKQVPRPAPLFDWAVGWLAREDKLVITADKRSFLLRLKHPSAKAPGS